MAARRAAQAFTGGGGATLLGLRRVGFSMRFNPADLESYYRDHEAVWPEMQEALVEAGWHNYSLFAREDGLAFGYFETDADFATACARMDTTDVNARWQREMAKYTPVNASPIDDAQELAHYFYLGEDRHLTAAADGGENAASPVAPSPGSPSPPFDKGWEPQASTAGSPTATGRNRVGFSMRFNPADLESYYRDHEAVWPEMQEALVEAGWHNYSLFAREDGLAFGYFETDADFATACARMDTTDVNARWQREMAKYTPVNASPIDDAQELAHYFHLGR
eukprot:g3553.t1